MLPFLVDMARLFERFVAEWLATHLPAHLRLNAQEKIEIDPTGRLYFNADLVIYNLDTGAVRYVLDTKYKRPGRPAPNDIAQVTAYAHFKESREAVLIYPAPLSEPLDIRSGNIRIRSLTFALDGDLEQAGRSFLAQLAGN